MWNNSPSKASGENKHKIAKVMIHHNANIESIEESKGLGDLKFGFTREEVEKMLGKPDEKETLAYSKEDHTEIWHYDELELSLSFDEDDDWELSTISITSDKYTFRGFQLIGMSKEQLEDELEELGIEDLQEEDWDNEDTPGLELLTSDELGINFWFDEGLLSEVEWGRFYEEEDDDDNCPADF